MLEVIRFYRICEPYGCFSNFAPYPVAIDGQVWPTTEHYFQAQKFADIDFRERIRLARTPAKAKGLGQSRKLSIRSDWDAVRVEVMRRAIRAKFTQYPDIGAMLLATNEAILVEHSANDPFWTDGGDGSGQNAFGQLLMELRAELAAEIHATAASSH
jgi:hypothetical protein